MPSETAINRLLYAILSQKDLRDIDWNKVAEDPVLAKEITNGHAARMRYSRWKKQMEGGAAIHRRKRPQGERTMRVEKKSRSKKEPRSNGASSGETAGARTVKLEALPSAASPPAPHVHARRMMMSPTSTPPPRSGPSTLPVIKREREVTGLSTPSPTSTPGLYPSTPLSMASSMPQSSQHLAFAQSCHRSHSPTPSLTYPSPTPSQPTYSFGMDDTIASYGGMSPFNLSMSSNDSHSQHSRPTSENSFPREGRSDQRSLWKQSVVAGRVLGPQQAFDMGYHPVPIEENLFWSVGEEVDHSGSHAGVGSEQGPVNKGKGKEREKIVGNRCEDKKKKVQVKTEQRWEEGYRRQ